MCDVTGADYFWLTQNAGHIHETSPISPIHFSELLGQANRLAIWLVKAEKKSASGP